MKILFVVPELNPIVKVGGLGDVAGALPKALQALGHDVRLLIPDYAQIDHQRYPSHPQWSNLGVPWCGQTMPVSIDVGTLPESTVPVYYLRCPELFAQPNVGGVYLEKRVGAERILEMQRFVFFSWATSCLLPQLPWQPELVHCHDWTAAPVPTFLNVRHGRSPYATVLTIHNLQNQGVWSADEVWSWLGLTGNEHPLLALRDEWHNFNALQQGIHAADRVNTVSPHYAAEILTAAYGEHLTDDLRQRTDGIVGILNGIDVTVFDPATDPTLASTFTSATMVAGKQANRQALQATLQLPVRGPLYGFVGRLTPQKGVDLILQALPDVFRRGGQAILLGTGWPDFEQQLTDLQRAFPDHLRAIIRFDATLAQRIYAASDYFLMPSKFEPCGLGQMIAMRYGTLPIVRDTGGLHDTVTDLTRDHRHGTGFVFSEYSLAAFSAALDASLRLYDQPDTVQAVAVRAMYQDFSWTTAATHYLELYEQANTKAATARNSG